MDQLTTKKKTKHRSAEWTEKERRAVFTLSVALQNLVERFEDKNEYFDILGFSMMKDGSVSVTAVKKSRPIKRSRTFSIFLPRKKA